MTEELQPRTTVDSTINESWFWALMRTSCAELLNVDAHYNWMMKAQAKHVRSLIHNGLTKSQKRRVQCLHQLEQHEEAERLVLDKKKVQSKVWHPKPKVDGEEDDKPRADINMVVFLLKESWLRLIRMCPMRSLA
jgi:hypothetical protein